eukprot:TRINITY_DN25145_c0_g1_i1.p1 TRINITY_DN25145_c0_g1~~TRINITY_DN25145_c0_g1_i1.p1  ORF type:complete len:236 (-),score=48.81 TRINITY_DN25145_c0_g1_i1:133-840(-)
MSSPMRLVAILLFLCTSICVIEAVESERNRRIENDVHESLKQFKKDVSKKRLQQHVAVKRFALAGEEYAAHACGEPLNALFNIIETSYDEMLEAGRDSEGNSLFTFSPDKTSDMLRLSMNVLVAAEFSFQIEACNIAMRDHPEWKEAIRFITNLEYTKVLFTGLHKVMAEALLENMEERAVTKVPLEYRKYEAKIWKAYPDKFSDIPGMEGSLGDDRYDVKSEETKPEPKEYEEL